MLLSLHRSIHFYLKFRGAEIKSLHSLAHTLNACNSQALGKSKARSQPIHRIACQGSNELSHVCLSVCDYKKLELQTESELELRPSTRKADISHILLNTVPKTHFPPFLLFINLNVKHCCQLHIHSHSLLMPKLRGIFKWGPMAFLTDAPHASPWPVLCSSLISPSR